MFQEFVRFLENRLYKENMKYNDFRQALEFVLKWEGGYVNDPDDPGGGTKWGITSRNHPNLDIRNLTPEHAAKIYQEEYWDAVGCNDIPFPFNVAVFDTAVNCGVDRASDWLRNSKNVYEFLAFRYQRYIDVVKKNPRMRKYIGGWLNRLTDLKKFIEINSEES